MQPVQVVVLVRVYRDRALVVAAAAVALVVATMDWVASITDLVASQAVVDRADQLVVLRRHVQLPLHHLQAGHPYPSYRL